MKKLGFGLMRLPLLDKNDNGSIDVELTKKMIDVFMERGFTYFDTAWMYCKFNSERAVKEALVDRYPRDSFYLATKLPAWSGANTAEEAKQMFYTSLQRTGAGYFDFYLLHNLGEQRTHFFDDYGIWDFLAERKQEGQIKHLGFSTHGSVQMMEQFLDVCGADMEFCQIQLNYLDWTLQDAKAKYDMLTRRGIPVWVMEPVRGGKLAALSDENSAKLKAMRPDEKDVAWCFRFLQSLPNVTMTLSGMSNMAQIQEMQELLRVGDVPLYWCTCSLRPSEVRADEAKLKYDNALKAQKAVQGE